MMDAIHRILAGSPLARKELIAAGVFVAVWFVIDVIEFVDWAQLKIWPAVVVCK